MSLKLLDLLTHPMLIRKLLCLKRRRLWLMEWLKASQATERLLSLWSRVFAPCRSTLLCFNSSSLAYDHGNLVNNSLTITSQILHSLEPLTSYSDLHSRAIL